MRYALAISYLGHDFCGWQAQKNQNSIEQNLEQALSKFTNESISLIGSGRTDSGVNALGQVAHFDSKVKRQDYQWILGTNSFLPPTIRILAIKKVDESFHARFSATKRVYRYLIYNDLIFRPFWHCRALHFSAKLDIKKMNQAAQKILGKRDFSSFRSSQCQAKNTQRNLMELKIFKFTNQLICIQISANAFLHNMVRILVGALIQIGLGKKKSNWLLEQLENKKRNPKIPTLSPYGLYLYQVHYPKQYQLDDFLYLGEDLTLEI